MKQTYVLLMCGSLLMAGAGCGKKTTDAEVPRTIPVAVQAAVEMAFTETLSLQGSVLSENYALVPAKIGGTLEELLVQEGSVVVKDQPLARLDSERLERGVETRRQALSVARSAGTVSRALVEQAVTTMELAAKDYERYRKLSDDKAVSVRQLDVAETQWKNAEAAQKVAVAQEELAAAQVKQAETALAIAERDLRDATIRAPIEGVISVKYRELGEMVEAGKPVFRMDDPASIEISAFVPAPYYSRIEPGKTLMQVRVNGHDLSAMPVEYRSPTADETLRTVEIKARLDNPPEGVVAGSLADVEVVLLARKGLGVPASAVLVRGGQTVLFAASHGKARSYPVKTGLQTGGMIEILEGFSAEAGPVVVQGQDMLNEGDALSIVEE